MSMNRITNQLPYTCSQVSHKDLSMAHCHLHLTSAICTPQLLNPATCMQMTQLFMHMVTVTHKMLMSLITCSVTCRTNLPEGISKGS